MVLPLLQLECNLSYLPVFYIIVYQLFFIISRTFSRYKTIYCVQCRLYILYIVLCKLIQKCHRTECSSLFHLNNTFFLSLYLSEKPDNPTFLQHPTFFICKPFLSAYISDSAKSIGKIRLFNVIVLLFSLFIY